MHIAIILGPFLPVPAVLGGAVEKVHLALAAAYASKGHRVTIISRQFADFSQDEIIDGIRYLRIPSRDRSSYLPVNLTLGLRYALRAAAAMPPADITITNEFFLPLVLPRRKAGKIYVQVGRFPKYQMLLYFRADRLQAVSQAVGSAIAGQTPWLSRKVAVIGYAISDVYYQPVPLRREKVILFVGRLAREKGVELLVKAFLLLRERGCRPLLDGWTLRIIGPHEPAQGGDGRGYLDSLIRLAAPLDGLCEFTGPIFDQALLAREYWRSSIFVYPSLAERGEALPVAPLEAMAAGCAVLASDLRCFDDYLLHGKTGLRFDHSGTGAIAALAGQLERLMTEPGLFSRLAAAGRRAALDFSVSAIAGRMLADFESLIAADL